jgi:hypothetical protein
MSERAWEAYERSDLPKFYLDLGPIGKRPRKTATRSRRP